MACVIAVLESQSEMHKSGSFSLSGRGFSGERETVACVIAVLESRREIHKSGPFSLSKRGFKGVKTGL